MSLSPLYVACRNGDYETVQHLLPTLTLDEINQIEPNGSTCLHAACYYNYPQIVEFLLDRGALRTILNNHGLSAYDEAATEHIKILLSRSNEAARVRFLTDVPLDEFIEWTSIENGQMGWRNKRHFQNTDVISAADVMVTDEKFQIVASTHKIEYYLEKAKKTEDPHWLAKAYSADMSFCQAINKALAQELSLLVGYSEHSEYFAFVSIFMRHNAFKKFRYAGKCYRGMKLSRKNFEENYAVGQTLLTKPFLSTSKSRCIAERFATSPSTGARPLSVLCIYTIPNRTLSYKDNVVLDISSISEYPHEEEVLILPFTSLEIKNINYLPSGLIEIETEWFSYIQAGRRKLGYHRVDTTESI